MDDIFNKLIEKYGIKHQYGKVVEELVELTMAVIHYQDGKTSYADIIGEIADVKIQLEQLLYLLAIGHNVPIKHHLDKIMKDKIKKLKRISNEENDE